MHRVELKALYETACNPAQQKFLMHRAELKV